MSQTMKTNPYENNTLSKPPNTNEYPLPDGQLMQPQPHQPPSQHQLGNEFIPQQQYGSPPARTASAPPTSQQRGGYQQYSGYVPRGYGQQQPMHGYSQAAQGIQPTGTESAGTSSRGRGRARGRGRGNSSMRSNAQQFIPQAYYGMQQVPYMGYQHPQHPGGMPHYMPYSMQHSQQQPPATPAVRPPAVRQRKVLEIIDPKTNKPIAAMERKKELLEKSATPQKKETTTNALSSTPSKTSSTEATSPLTSLDSAASQKSQETPGSPNIMFGTVPSGDIPPQPLDSDSKTEIKDSNPVAEPSISTPDDSEIVFGEGLSGYSSPTPAEELRKQVEMKLNISPSKDNIKIGMEDNLKTVENGVSKDVAEKIEQSLDNEDDDLEEGEIRMPKDNNESWESESKDLHVASPPKKEVVPTTTWNDKIVYSVKELLSFQEKYTELPEKAKLPGSGWEEMDIIEIATKPGGRGNRGSGWERGSQQHQGQMSRTGSNRQGSEWQRSQELPRRRSDRGGRGRGRGRGDEYLEPVKPLDRTENRWVPTKSTCNLTSAVKLVNGLMNKMTRDNFSKLASQLCSMKMDSLEMLRAVINLIFDKALREPNFCDMYADLCVRLNIDWKVWSFLKIVRNDDEKKFYWTTLSENDADVVGPFDQVEDVFASIDSGSISPIPAPESMSLFDLRIRTGMLIKLWKDDEEKYYWSGERLDDLPEDYTLHGPHDTQEEAMAQSAKQTSFKRILLNSCQEEFQKENQLQDFEMQIQKAKQDDQISAEEIEDMEEKRHVMKHRMLGNIRFIGELFKKGMLQERIMHECILKLLECTFLFDEKGLVSGIKPLHPKEVVDEENLESLSKLLTTIGKNLESTSSQTLNLYFSEMDKLSRDTRITTRIRFMLKDVLDLRQNRWTPRRKELKQKTLEQIRKDAQQESTNKARLDHRSHSMRSNQGHGSKNQPQVYQNRNNPFQRTQSARASENYSVERPRQRDGNDNITLAPRGRSAFATNKGKKPPANNSPGHGNKPRNIVETVPLSTEEQATLKKKIINNMKEFVEVEDKDDAVSCVGELKEKFPQLDDYLLKEICLFYIEAKESNQPKLLELLHFFYSKNIFDLDHIQRALMALYAVVSDLQWDVPCCAVYFGQLVATFIEITHPTAPGLTLKWCFELCAEDLDDDLWDDLTTSRLLFKIFTECCRSIPTKSILYDQVRTCEHFFISFFMSMVQEQSFLYSRIEDWIQKNDLEAIFQLKDAFAIAKMVENRMSSEDIITWIESNVKESVRKDHLFAQQVFLYIVEISMTQSETTHLPMHSQILMGLGGDEKGQLSCLHGLQQMIPTDQLSPLFRHLYDEHIISKEVFQKWKEYNYSNRAVYSDLKSAYEFITALK